MEEPKPVVRMTFCNSATVTKKDNTFVVETTEDCVIEIIFVKDARYDRCPLCVMAEKNPLFRRHIHVKPRNP